MLPLRVAVMQWLMIVQESKLFFMVDGIVKTTRFLMIFGYGMGRTGLKFRQIFPKCQDIFWLIFHRETKSSQYKLPIVERGHGMAKNLLIFKSRVHHLEQM